MEKLQKRFVLNGLKKHEWLRVMPGHSVITAHLCVSLSPCIVCCIARLYLVMLNSGLTADSVALVPVPKCRTDN